MTKQVHSAQGMEISSQRLNEAEDRHRSLDARVKALGRRAFLTPQEQVEMAELKKEKLRTKDEIQALRRHSP